MNFGWKALDHSQNKCEGLPKWAFVTLGTTFTYTTANVKNLERFPWSQSIYWRRQVELQNRHPQRNLPQTYGGSKSVCLFWIRPTEHFLTHLRKSFSINVRRYNKYDTHKSKMNKIRLERRTWRIFYIRQRNQLNQIIFNTQPKPSPQSSTNLWEKKILLSGLYTSNRNVSNTPEDKFQNKWILV